MQENGIYRKGLLSVKIETATGTVSRVDGGFAIATTNGTAASQEEGNLCLLHHARKITIASTVEVP